MSKPTWQDQSAAIEAQKIEAQKVIKAAHDAQKSLAKIALRLEHAVDPDYIYSVELKHGNGWRRFRGSFVPYIYHTAGEPRLHIGFSLRKTKADPLGNNYYIPEEDYERAIRLAILIES